MADVDDELLARVFWPQGGQLVDERAWLVGSNVGGLELCVTAVLPMSSCSAPFLLDRISCVAGLVVRSS